MGGDGVTDGTRTRDNRNHNPGLYQLSYDHHLWDGSVFSVTAKKAVTMNRRSLFRSRSRAVEGGLQSSSSSGGREDIGKA
jgi:hypothetical protein